MNHGLPKETKPEQCQKRESAKKQNKTEESKEKQISGKNQKTRRAEDNKARENNTNQIKTKPQDKQESPLNANCHINEQKNPFNVAFRKFTSP